MKKLFYIFAFMIFVMVVPVRSQAATYLAPNGQEYNYYYSYNFITSNSCDCIIYSKYKIFAYSDGSLMYRTSNGGYLGVTALTNDSYCYAERYTNGKRDTKANLLISSYFNGVVSCSYDFPFFSNINDALEYAISPDAPVPDDYQLSDALGSLKGFQDKSKVLRISTTDKLNLDNVIFSLGWDNDTTSGKNLFFPSPFRDIQVQFSVAINMQKKDVFGNVTDTKVLSHEYDLFPATQLKYEWNMFENMNIWGLEAFNNYQVVDYSFYFRLLAESDAGYFRSKWVKVSLDPETSKGLLGDTGMTGAALDISAGDMEDNVFYKDVSDAYYGQGQSGNIGAGAGASKDEAYNNIVSGSDVSMFGDLPSMVEQVKDVPLAFAAIFSFLPGWILQLFALSISLSIALLVIKMIRG